MTEQLLRVGYETDTNPELLVLDPRHRAEQMGAIGLTGFTIMEAVESPWEMVRDSMKERVIDQDPAIDAIIEALDASNARSKHDNTPLATFAFLGPSGVGKSETGKTLADVLREGHANLIKIDCSEFSSGHEVANLTGSPLGYVGSTTTPKINKADIEKAGTVVLFDEIEKGSEELYDLMLQIMADGQLTVTGGEVVSFREAIIIMTSNLGAKEMAAQLSTTSLGFKRAQADVGKEELERVANTEFDKFFKTEFIGRIDKKVVFHPLSTGGLGRVLDVKLGKLNEEYTDDYGARLSLSDATKGYLVAEAKKQPELGARPLVQAFKTDVQTTFGRYIASGTVGEGTHVKVFHASDAGEVDSNRLIFATEPDTTLKRTKKAELIHVPESDAFESVEEEQEANEE